MIDLGKGKRHMNIAIVLSGGTGSRIGLDIPKQYIKVGGKMVISYCLLSLFDHELIDGVVIVADSDYHELISQEMAEVVSVKSKDKFLGFALPGENRQLSIYNGLLFLNDKVAADDVVLIHDAARPHLSNTLIADCVSLVEGYDGVLPVLAMKDTVYMSEDGKSITALIDRKKIYAGQAPEAFLYGKYKVANEKLMPGKILDINGSSEPAIMDDMNIRMIPGDEQNYKITTIADLEKFRSEIE